MNPNETIVTVAFMVIAAGAIWWWTVDSFVQWLCVRELRRQQEAPPDNVLTFLRKPSDVYTAPPVGKATVAAPWVIQEAPRDAQGQEIVQ